MIAHVRPRPKSTPQWHAAFLAMLPAIIRYAKASFREFDPETREDLVQECIANCVVAFARLVERGKQSLGYPTVLAMYAVRQIKDGRRVGKKQNVRDVYDQHARVKGGYQLQYIGTPHEQCGGWKEQLVENDRTPVPDQAAFRIDFPEWLASLSARDRKITEQLAVGERTGTVAKRFHVSAGRVCQLRGQLKESWDEFEGESGAPATGTEAE
jgi:DNA-directed RNA polymerase specialized sigma24 family protein